MPLQKVLFKPGVNREGTTLTNEGSWFESDKVRFRSGNAEKIGGWVAISYSRFMGVCRSLWNWVTLKSFNLLGVGTNQKFYIENSGNYYDITPINSTKNISSIAVTADSYTATVTLSTTESFETGDIVNISGVTGTVGGLAATIFNQQYVLNYVSATAFTILLREVSALESSAAYKPAVSTQTVTFSPTLPTADFLLPTGYPIYTAGTGWGTGTWSRSTWGSGFGVGVTGLQLRLWSQANFGEDLIFCPRNGALYRWAPGSGSTPAYGTRATKITGVDVPAVVDIVMVSDATRIVIAFGCNELGTYGTTTYDPLLIRWSTNEDYLTWTPSITNQAGGYRLSHGSSIVAALQTRQEILVWTDAAIYSMQYLGPPYIWGFNILADNISVISPNSVATANGVVYWMGTDKFYRYSGRVETLPSTLRQYVFQNINRSQGYQVYAGTNEAFSEIWWFYCSETSNMVDRYVVYNYLDDVWHHGSMDRTAWLDSPVRPYPQAALGVQTTLVAVAVSEIATAITVANSSSYATSGFIKLDNEIIYYTNNSGNVFTGCQRGMYGTTPATHPIDTIVHQYGSNVVLYHEYGNDDASEEAVRPIEAFVQSSDFDLDDGDRYSFVWQMIPDFSFDGSTTPRPDTPSLKMALRPRQNPGSVYGTAPDPTVASTQDYQDQHTYTVQEFTEVVNTRIRGRQVAMRISSDTLGTQWQLGAVRINLRPDGRR